MGWFNLLKKNSESLPKVVDSAISGIDKLFYTKEEKADDRKKTEEQRLKVADSLADFVRSTLEENSERSKFRRQVGNKIINMYILLSLGTIITAIFKKDLTPLMIELLGLWTFGFGSVIVFLFGGYYLNKFTRKPSHLPEDKGGGKKPK